MSKFTKFFTKSILFIFILNLFLIPVSTSAFEDPVIDPNINIIVNLNAEGNVEVYWSKYNRSENFTFYRVIKSQTNDNPIFGSDEAINEGDANSLNVDKLAFVDDNVSVGDNYYRVCHIAYPKIYCSESVVLINKQLEEQEDIEEYEEEDIGDNEEDTEEDVEEDLSQFNIILEGELSNDKKSVDLNWELQNDINAPSGFVIIWSKFSNPTYPIRDVDYFKRTNVDVFTNTIDYYLNSGKYYFRVCVYNGEDEECSDYSNEIYFDIDLEYESEEDEEDAEDEEDEDEINNYYTNTKYNFELEFPNIWVENDYKVSSHIVDNVESLCFSFDRELPLCIFQIYIYSKEKWDNLGQKPSYIVMKNDKVFSYDYDTECTQMDDFQCDRTEEVKDIIDSFTFYEGGLYKTDILLKGYVENNDIHLTWKLNTEKGEGYLVLWSKEKDITFPINENDDLSYVSNMDQATYKISNLDNEKYYVKLCIYENDDCSKFSNELSFDLSIIDGFFQDVKSNSWAKNYIYNLAKQGVVEGRSENKFEPEANINRAEYVKMIVEAFYPNMVKYVDKNESSFEDINTDEWYNEYVIFAKNMKLISGYEDNTFKPGNNITRAESLSIITKVLDLQIQNEPTVPFSDVHDLWQKQYIEATLRFNIVSGYEDGNFGPNDNLTREQAAKIIYNSQKIEN